MKDPLDHIKWLSAKELKPNFWNPNAVFGPELRLLRDLILRYGWIQPLLVSRDYIIIDGFHRWRLSLDDKGLLAQYAGLVPCAILDMDEQEAMLLTATINRAKGTAVAVRMSHLIIRLIDEYGMEKAEVAKRIGGTKQEVEALYEDSVWKTLKLDEHVYSKAWVPYESTTDDADSSL
jgi:ParB-like chromosome segregation protein Spo0J